MSTYGMIGAVLFLALGILELALLYRVVYPQLRWRHEKAKTTQSHGIEPGRVMLIFKLQALLAMPVIGYMIGSQMQETVG